MLNQENQGKPRQVGCQHVDWLVRVSIVLQLWGAGQRNHCITQMKGAGQHDHCVAEMGGGLFKGAHCVAEMRRWSG